MACMWAVQARPVCGVETSGTLSSRLRPTGKAQGVLEVAADTR